MNYRAASLESLTQEVRVCCLKARRRIFLRNKTYQSLRLPFVPVAQNTSVFTCGRKIDHFP